MNWMRTAEQAEQIDSGPLRWLAIVLAGVAGVALFLPFLSAYRGVGHYQALPVFDLARREYLFYGYQFDLLFVMIIASIIVCFGLSLLRTESGHRLGANLFALLATIATGLEIRGITLFLTVNWGSHGPPDSRVVFMEWGFHLLLVVLAVGTVLHGWLFLRQNSVHAGLARLFKLCLRTLAVFGLVSIAYWFGMNSTGDTLIYGSTLLFSLGVMSYTISWSGRRWLFLGVAVLFAALTVLAAKDGYQHGIDGWGTGGLLISAFFWLAMAGGKCKLVTIGLLIVGGILFPGNYIFYLGPYFVPFFNFSMWGLLLVATLHLQIAGRLLIAQ
ncbi:MAG: hypothetical protein FH749_02910 [Firmicutes bacterium]|nr:hypothetical protein [Bacillota bacterium]